MKLIVVLLLFYVSLALAEGEVVVEDIEEGGQPKTESQQEEQRLPSFETWDQLREAIPIEHFEATQGHQEFRKDMQTEAGRDEDVHRWWAGKLSNLIELNVESYEIYVLNHTTDSLHFENVTWVIMFVTKDERNSLFYGGHLHNLSAELEQTHPGRYKFTYVDTDVDGIMYETYRARFEPHIFVLDPETGMAYSWEMQYNHTDAKSWLLEKWYLTSQKQFKAPQLIALSEWASRRRWRAVEEVYRFTIGKQIRTILRMLGPLKDMPPISYFYVDSAEADEFGRKMTLQIYVFFGVCAIICLLAIQMFRKLCCSKKKYVLKPKSAEDKKDN